VQEHSKQHGHDAGTTVVCAVVVNACVYAVNCGDSRCVLARRIRPSSSLSPSSSASDSAASSTSSATASSASAAATAAAAAAAPYVGGAYGVLRPASAAMAALPTSPAGCPVGAPAAALAAGAPPPPPPVSQPPSYGPSTVRSVAAQFGSPTNASASSSTSAAKKMAAAAAAAIAASAAEPPSAARLRCMALGVRAVDLTLDHKPARFDERARIELAGGQVLANTHSETALCGLVEREIDGPLRVFPGGLR
jgi:hypothetical protein